MNDQLETIHCGDCIDGMNALPAKSVHLVFADPPFNIGYKYDVYEDRMAAEDYLNWSTDWMQAVSRILRNDGTFWLAIGDEFAAELKVAATKSGFHMRSWVIWYYTFGVNCKSKFTRSHTHLFYFVKDPELFTFRGDDPENRVPSARQLVYNDRRANSAGRLPDDTWIIPPNVDQTFALRPQDLSEQFNSDEDTWYFPRIAGTFKERAGFHGCQMPEQLLGRIIRSCSNDRDIVLDPFAGSASTLIVARKLGRRVIGFELSEEYTKAGSERLDSVKRDDPLTGAPEPTMSAKPTPGKQAASPDPEPVHDAARSDIANTAVMPPDAVVAPTPKDQQPATDSIDSADLAAASPAGKPVSLPRRLAAVLNETIAAAFEKTHQGWAVDRVVADPELQKTFYQECVRMGLPLSQKETCLRLLKLRKIGGALRGTERYSVSSEQCEPYLHACEIAWAVVHADHPDISIEEILADPKLAARFDRIAKEFSPGFTSLDYRWGALRLRKTLKKTRTKAATLNAPRRFWLGERFAGFRRQEIPKSAGVYLIYRDNECVYVGSATDLRQRLSEVTAKPSERWDGKRRQLSFRYFITPPDERDLLAWVGAVINHQREAPMFNLNELHANHSS
jgi:DNA modification methylase